MPFSASSDLITKNNYTVKNRQAQTLKPMNTTFNLEDLDFSYIIGIDLGTTNTAVAYVDLTSESSRKQRKIHFFEPPQVVALNEVGPRSILPSFLYFPGKYDLPENSFALPWDAQREYIVGEFAREQGAKVPGRLVASAKSWLSHSGVDRRAPILPWGAEGDIPKVSPVDASMRYLQHIREAWDFQMRRGLEEFQFDQQLIVLTVPASFDEVARELTVTAARQAGIPRVILIEEPLAAFYAWLSKNEDSWQQQMRDGQLVLVCDVGGGTTDFSIIGIKEGEKGLRFNRLAVGEHLMLGGDNMDLALGRYLETQIMDEPGKLDARRWHQLVYQCRKAKETLLGAPETLAKMDITVIGQTASLIAGTLKGSLSQAEIQQLIFDGFFPEVPLSDAPENKRSGLTEFGLPYVKDPAITRHAAAFWRKFEDLMRQETGREKVYPDFILFNGGALTPQSVRWHLTLIFKKWFAHLAGSDWLPAELPNPRPELAVAIGAAYYGMVKLGEGVRVGSGSPRAYYVAVKTAAASAEPETQRAVCLIPRGTEEGFEIHLDQLNFQALANQPVTFQLYTSSNRLGDQLGDIVQLETEEMTVLPPIRTVLRFGKKAEARQIPINLAVRLTEIGTLELYCESKETRHRWQLQFDVRQDTDISGEAQSMGETVDQELIETAQRRVRDTFSGSDAAESIHPEQLTKTLEKILGLKKEKWPTPLIRKLADTLLEVSNGRSLSAAHEARWLNLCGFCLRPGFGDPLDEWRMKQIWKLHFEKIKFPNSAQCRAEWWIFWRRVAGGLTPGKQSQIFQQILPILQTANTGTKGKKSKSTRRIKSHEKLEIWMALANFERLAPKNKVQLGEMLLKKLHPQHPNSRELWAISRIGARQPFYGTLDRLVPMAEVENWIETLLKLKVDQPELMANTLIQLARYTGDRTRDIPESLRLRVAEALAALPNGEQLKSRLMNLHQKMAPAEQDWLFGESLPTGLAINDVEG